MYAVKSDDPEKPCDVRVYYSYDQLLVCGECELTKQDYTEFHSTEDLVDHLVGHRRAGHAIPDGLIDEIWEDDKENFSWKYRDDDYDWFDDCPSGHYGVEWEE